MCLQNLELFDDRVFFKKEYHVASLSKLKDLLLTSSRLSCSIVRLVIKKYSVFKTYASYLSSGINTIIDGLAATDRIISAFQVQIKCIL